MTDLGDLPFFFLLGIEANRHDANVLLLTQNKYSLDILKRSGMLGYKPCNTLATSGSKLSTNSGTPLSDPIEYRQLMGALQYLTLACLDLCYSVNQFCQFMHAPTTDHLLAIKCILRYFKSSIGSGLHLHLGSLLMMITFFDADWVGCP